MGACSSVEVVEIHPNNLMQPLPTDTQKPSTSSPSVPSTSASVAHHAPSLLPPPSSTLSPPSPDSRPESLDRLNRHSTSANSPFASSLRLASLTLDTNDPSDDSASTAAAFTSPTSAPPLDRTPTAVPPPSVQTPAPSSSDGPSPYRNDVSPKHESRTRPTLNPRRHQKAAGEQSSAGGGKVEEEKTQPADLIDAKRGSGLMSRIQRASSLKKRSNAAAEYAADEKRSTLEQAAATIVAANAAVVGSGGGSAIPGVEGKRLSGLFGGSMKKSASVDQLMLPAAPAIPTTRLPSEVAILDVIRTLGLSQSVSATTLSQYTRCIPPTLAGPLPRSPRGSYTGAAALVGGVGCCAKLHCDGCGMDVMMLDHHRWVERVDADVFRDCYPEVQRLRPSLVASVGSRAYCCACNWTDVKGPVQVRDAVKEPERTLQWVCAGHQ